METSNNKPPQPADALASNGPRDFATAPTSVRAAVACLAVSGLLMILLLVGPLMGIGQGTFGGANWRTGFTALVLILVVQGLWRGRRWAWWLNAAAYGLGQIATVVSFVVIPNLWDFYVHSVPPFVTASALVHQLLQTAAMILLLAGKARVWFRL